MDRQLRLQSIAELCNFHVAQRSRRKNYAAVINGEIHMRLSSAAGHWVEQHVGQFEAVCAHPARWGIRAPPEPLKRGVGLVWPNVGQVKIPLQNTRELHQCYQREQRSLTARHIKNYAAVNKETLWEPKICGRDSSQVSAPGCFSGRLGKQFLRFLASEKCTDHEEIQTVDFTAG